MSGPPPHWVLECPPSGRSSLFPKQPLSLCFLASRRPFCMVSQSLSLKLSATCPDSVPEALQTTSASSSRTGPLGISRLGPPWSCHGSLPPPGSYPLSTLPSSGSSGNPSPGWETLRTQWPYHISPLALPPVLSSTTTWDSLPDTCFWTSPRASNSTQQKFIFIHSSIQLASSSSTPDPSLAWGA